MERIRFLFLFSILLLVTTVHSLSEAEKQQLLANPEMAAMLQQKLGAGGMNALEQMKGEIQVEGLLSRDSSGKKIYSFQDDDSSGLIYPDSALWIPNSVPDSVYRYVTDSINSLDSLDSLDSLATDTLPQRYVRQIFQAAPPSLFGSVTNRVGKNYPLKSGDVLVVSMWGDQEREYTLSISTDGSVFLQGAGRIAVNGLTLGAAEHLIKNRLAKRFSGIRKKTAFVALSLKKLSPLKVFLLGEVANPGGYVFHGNTGIFQALYQARGPSEIGSVRRIQVSRNQKSFVLDLYDYLFDGIVPDSSILLDGDVIYLPRAERLVEVKGDVGRPGIYELDSGEGVAELLKYSGELNITAAAHRLVVRRIVEDGSVNYINLEKPSLYLEGKTSVELANGDLLRIEQSVERSRQNATVQGAVKYPGTYGLKKGMNVKDLVEVAGGTLEEAYLDRVLVVRPHEDGSYTLQSQSLTEKSKIELVGRDTVIVYSKREMFYPDSITISGAVFNPGRYEYYDGIRAKDLILMAGGFLPNREKGKIRLDRVEVGKQEIKTTIFPFDDNYKTKGKPLQLRPMDHLAIPSDPQYYKPEIVHLRGAFTNPGDYALLKAEEDIKSLIERSGGFKKNAYLGGAQFFRKQNDAGQIGINLPDALEEDDHNNIALLGGDSLFVPPGKISVKVYGAVGNPSSVLWKDGEDVDYYIRRAGGFQRLADDEHVVLKFANGESTPQADQYREPDPGAEIFVPWKPERKPIVWTEVLRTVATVFTAMATTLVAVMNVIATNK